MSEWQLAINTWPGPDRKKWPGLRDIIQESPDGRHVAVVYSCGEVGIGKEIGRIAILSGPPESPRLLLRPRCFACLVSNGGTSVQWIGGRYCVATPYGIRRCFSGRTKAFGGTMYIDVEQRKAAYLHNVYNHIAVLELPAGLAWRSWAWLSLWPVLWCLWKNKKEKV